MDNRAPDRNNYEELYTTLLDRGEQLHENNKKRIRVGIILMIILPFVLEFIRQMTRSDKVFFLVIWIICMFVISALLITVEYIDSTVEGALREAVDKDTEFDELLHHPELPHYELPEIQLSDIVKARVEQHRARLRLFAEADGRRAEDEPVEGGKADAARAAGMAAATEPAGKEDAK